MANKDGEEGNSFGMPSASNLLKFIHDQDARVGLVISIFILFLSTAITFVKTFGFVLTVESFLALMKVLGWLLLAAASFVVFFKAIDGTIIPKVMVWYFVIVSTVTMSLFWLQLVLRQPLPFLIEARCFWEPMRQGCPLGIERAEDVSLPVNAIENPEPQPQIIPANNRVFVHFAGALAREDVTRVSEKLDLEDWNVADPKNGGERIATAAGINQVRYFHDSDVDPATILAQRYNELADWPGFTPLSVARIRNYEDQVPLGHFEIWTSVY